MTQKGKSFTDPDLPPLYVDFPFDVVLLEKENLNTQDQKGFLYYLVTEDMDPKKSAQRLNAAAKSGVLNRGREYQILILREELVGGRYYTRKSWYVSPNFIPIISLA